MDALFTLPSDSMGDRNGVDLVDSIETIVNIVEQFEISMPYTVVNIFQSFCRLYRINLQNFYSCL